MAHTFTQENFDAEVLKSSVPVLVDFWATWCGPCRMTGPIIDELSEEIDEAKLKIGKVDVSDGGELAQTYNIMSIPAFLVFQNGAVVDQFVGGMSKDAFKAKLKNYIA